MPDGNIREHGRTKKLIALSSVLATDKGAFICDMAETYGIYDWRAVPVQTLAVLVTGLGPNSRIGMKALGVSAPFDSILLARILDDLNMIIWSWSEDAKHGTNRPESYADMLAGATEKHKAEGYATGEDFKKARANILKRIKG